MFLLIIFILIIWCRPHPVTSESEASNIEIIPNFIVVNSFSIANFTCTNHQSDDSIIGVSLSKLISPDEIKISTTKINKTVTNIQLQLNKYVGIFHLLCYLNGEQSKGTRADVVVKAAPGVLQLAEPCRVYDRKYIKCRIRAPTIAMAIQNDYPATFEFEEINYSTDQTAYLPRHQFLKNESTNEYLVFKWKPTVDEVFPEGIRMLMKATLSYFDPSSYYFDMSPVFQITPTFSLQAISSSEIQINFTPPNPQALCDKTILPKLSLNMSQGWTPVESDRPRILIKNLVSNSIYRVCMKCRQTFKDRDGIEKCEEIKTLAPSISKHFIDFTIVTLMLITLIILFVLIYCWCCRRQRGYKHKVLKMDDHQQAENANLYEFRMGETLSQTSLHSNCSTMVAQNTQGDAQNYPYIPIANLNLFKELCSEPRTLSSRNLTT